MQIERNNRSLDVDRLSVVSSPSGFPAHCGIFIHEAWMGGLYNYRWQLAREAYLYAHPLCLYCEQEGRTEPATLVDHIQPHRGNASLFWDRSNWQALCTNCHNSTKQRQETSGKRQGTSLSGDPVDPAHHWFT